MTGNVNRQFQGSANSAKAPKHNITKELTDLGERGMQLQTGINEGAEKIETVQANHNQGNTPTWHIF